MYRYKQHILPVLGAVFIIIVLVWSVEAAFTALAGFAALLFGDNRRKRTELEMKADKIKQVEQESRAVADELERINRAQRTSTDDKVAQRESEIDEWLDT